MAEYEYKTVPVPRRPKKVRGVRGPGPQAAATFSTLINAEAVEGWRYLGMELVPIQQGGGFFSRPHVIEQAVLVFERARVAGAKAEAHQEVATLPASPPIAAPASPSAAAPPSAPAFSANAQGDARAPEGPMPTLGGAEKP